MLFFDFLEDSTSSSDLSSVTADLQLNAEEKAEDWLQVGKRNRTHVLRTVHKHLFSWFSKRFFSLFLE
jgi:hypothetical protein